LDTTLGAESLRETPRLDARAGLEFVSV
jgi:hypothetical protein